MTPINDGGPAFPKPLDPYPNAQGMESGTHGMSLRDWFAGQAHPLRDEHDEGGAPYPHPAWR